MLLQQFSQLFGTRIVSRPFLRIYAKSFHSGKISNSCLFCFANKLKDLANKIQSHETSHEIITMELRNISEMLKNSKVTSNDPYCHQVRQVPSDLTILRNVHRKLFESDVRCRKGNS